MIRLFASIAILLLSTPAYADDGVVVVSSGGTTSVRVLELEPGIETDVIDRGKRRVIPSELGPQIINDVKVLPDGTHLVAGGDSLGLMVTDEEGAEILTLSRAAAYGAVASASVGAYFSGAEPSRILIGSDTVSAAFIRQVSSERLLFFEPTRLSESRAQHAEVIVLPDNAIAVAARYPAVGLSALDLISFADGVITRQRYSDGDSVGHPPETTVDPAFADIRDVHGFGGETPLDLLVVTRTQAFRLAEDGSRTWTTTLGDVGLGGEFASGVVLPSGRIALAVFEPGRWIEPHPNHRIVWLEPDGTFTGTMSGPLQAAPVSIDALEGHGGTGTTGFTAGLDTLPLGSADDLVLASPILLDKAVYRQGETITASVSVAYEGANAVSLERLRLVGAPEQMGCADVEIPIVDFARDESVTILSGESYPLSGSRVADSVVGFGTWCVWVEVADTTGRLFRLGEPASFDVVEQGGDAGGEPIPSTPIGFGAPDAGTDAGDMGDAGIDGSDDSGGCGCTSTPSAAASWLALFAGLFLVRRRRR